MTTGGDDQTRVVVFAPSGRDGVLAAQVLASAGIGAHVCADEHALCSEIIAGAGAVLLTDYVLARGWLSPLGDVLARQPVWSDLPIVVLAARAPDHPTSRAAHEALRALGNAMILERPLSPSSLVSAVSGALRARQRQYAFRDLLARIEREVEHRDQFLAMLGHELRNPLGAIRNATEVLMRHPSTDDAMTRQVSVLDRQARHLGRMVDDLLDVSRISAGKIALKLAALDVHALVETVVSQLKPWALDKGLELSCAGECDATVEGDPVRLEQVFSNLVTNAIKYTPAGGRIAVTVAVEGNEAVVTVADSGVGIATEMLPHIFDLFRQAEGTLDRSHGGMGIGLTLVRSLVTMHRGRVEAHSPGLGCGAEFVVRLPVTSGRPDAIPARLPRAPAVQPRHILVVDDSADNCESLRDLLQELGHRVDVAFDGPSAVESALRLRPDVGIIDIGLPGYDGYAVAQKIRLELGPGMFLVALTGYGQADDRRRAETAGFDAHLTKPADVDDLQDLITGQRAAR